METTKLSKAEEITNKFTSLDGSDILELFQMNCGPDDLIDFVKGYFDDFPISEYKENEIKIRSAIAADIMNILIKYVYPSKR